MGHLLAERPVSAVQTPAPPTTISPGALDRPAAIEQRCPTLSWAAFPGGQRYELAIFDLPAGGAALEGEPARSTVLAGAAFSWTPALEDCLAPGTYEVSTSGYHTCGVKTDGTLACWGYNGNGAASPPAGTFNAISAGRGGGHSCAVRSDGSAVCWGLNNSGQSAAPAGTFIDISAGATHSCGLRTDGTVSCWGDNAQGETNAPGGAFVSVSAGMFFSCGLRGDGSLSCWGRNDEGQLAAPAGSHAFLAAERLFACAIGGDDAVACWGDNSAGQTVPPPWL